MIGISKKRLLLVLLLISPALLILGYQIVQACLPPPNAPSNLVATTVSSTEIRLNWTDNSTNELGFKLEWSPNGSTGWTQFHVTGANVATYNVTNHNGTNLSPNTTYHYHVHAYNGNGTSSPSNVHSATTDPEFSGICTP